MAMSQEQFDRLKPGDQVRVAANDYGAHFFPVGTVVIFEEFESPMGWGIFRLLGPDSETQALFPNDVEALNNQHDNQEV